MTHTSGQEFGKGVNQYLNTAVAFADAKATAFLAGTLTVGASLLQFENATGLGSLLRLASVLTLAAGIAANAAVIIPRLSSGRRGLVFWDDIRSHPQLEDYLRATTDLSQDDIEKEYAAQNYFVAEIAQRKHTWVRRSIGLFLAGLAFTAGAYLAR